MQWQNLTIGLAVSVLSVSEGCRQLDSPSSASTRSPPWNETQRKGALEQVIPAGTPLADAIVTLESNGFTILPDQDRDARYLNATKSEMAHMLEQAKWRVLLEISDGCVTKVTVKIEYIGT